MKSYTDLEQSKKLAEILPLESADMWWLYVTSQGKHIAMMYEEPDPHYLARMESYGIKDCAIRCWSLAALRNLLPVGIKVNENTYLFGSHNTFDKCWVYRYYNEDDTSYLYYKNINEVDACCEMILKLHELKMV